MNRLQVWWIPQVPGEPFVVPVANLIEAKLLLSALADYDKFQFARHIKPDYCNAGGLQIDRGEGWEDWTPENVAPNGDQNDIDDFTLEELREARHATSEI